MKAARLYAPGDLRPETSPDPEPGPGELVVRVRGCAICGTDVKIFNHGHHHLVLPRVIGHEIAGEIVAVGDRAGGWRPGDRVQVAAAIPCGMCRYCRRGQETVCENLESIGYHRDGGFAELMLVPAKVLAQDMVNHLPDGVPLEAACLAEPLACVLNGQELVGLGQDDEVVVIGAGPIGCLHVRLARARGAARVVLLDINRQRLEQAQRVAPDAAICSAEEDPVEAVRSLTGGRGADVVITACSSGQAQEQALAMAARRGRVSFFGGLPQDHPFINCNSNLIHYRELSVTGAYGSTPRQNRQALEMVASGAVPVSDLITHRLPLDRVEEGIRLAARGDALKVVMLP